MKNENKIEIKDAIQDKKIFKKFAIIFHHLNMERPVGTACDLYHLFPERVTNYLSEISRGKLSISNMSSFSNSVQLLVNAPFTVGVDHAVTLLLLNFNLT